MPRNTDTTNATPASNRTYGRRRIKRYLEEMASMPSDWWEPEHLHLLRQTADRIAPTKENA